MQTPFQALLSAVPPAVLLSKVTHLFLACLVLYSAVTPPVQTSIPPQEKNTSAWATGLTIEGKIFPGN